MPDPSRPSRAPEGELTESHGQFDPTEPPADDPAGETDGTLAEPNFTPPEHAGEVGTFGRYRVLKKLGQGGMGAVYLGYDGTLERKVALKVMLPQFAARTGARGRFLREARSAAKVKSDHVVTIFDVGEACGVPFIAMEYLLGHPLDQFLKVRGELPLAQVLRVTREAALGLAAAHALGLVHRDVKPANLWLEAPNGRVKLLDFGLARETDDDAHLTGSGAVVGTPAYMSPEQGRGLKVDHRSDLFSVGVMLYRLTTGAMPFTGATTMAVLSSLALDTPAPVRRVNAKLPEALEALISKLLAKNPADRFQTAAEVAAALLAVARPPAGGLLPVVVATPLAVGAQTQNVWEGIDESGSVAVPLETGEETEATSVPQPPRQKPERKPSKLPAVLAGVGLLVACAVLAAVIIRPWKQETVAGDGGENLPPKGGVKPPPPPPALDPDRKAAEYALSVGGTVGVNGDPRVVAAAADLPKGPFALTVFNASRQTSVTDAGLAAVRGCKNVRVLYLNESVVSDAGLAPFAGCTELTTLTLYSTTVSDAGLAHLKDCKRLTHVHLAHTRVTDAALAQLKDCADLTHLTVQNTQVTPAAVAELARALPRCKIEHNGGTIEPTAVADRKAAEYVLSRGGSVRVNGSDRDTGAVADLPTGRFALTQVLLVNNPAATDAELVRFADCKSLAYLDLSGAPVTDAGMAHLKGCTGLTHLVLGDTQVGDAGLIHFKGRKNLTVLYLPGTRVTDTGLSYFADCKDMTRLSLNATQVTDEGLKHFQDCKNLTVLNVRRTKVSAAKAAAFAQSHPQCRIEHDGGIIEPTPADDRQAAKHVLSLGGFVQVNGENRDIKTAADLPKDRFALTLVSLINNRNVTNAGLAQLKDCKRLTYLDLYGTPVTDAGLAHLADCKSLTHLILGDTRVGDAGLAHFKDRKGLVRLHLYATQVTDAGLSHFKDCKNMTELFLHGTQVTDAGLVNFKDCKNLTILNFNSTRIGDAGLANFKGCTNLTQLALNDTQVGDAGLELFKGCDKLTKLDVRGTKVSAAKVAEFKKALPQCAIDYSGRIVGPRKK